MFSGNHISLRNPRNGSVGLSGIDNVASIPACPGTVLYREDHEADPANADSPFPVNIMKRYEGRASSITVSPHNDQDARLRESPESLRGGRNT